MQQHVYSRKSDCIYNRNLKGTSVKLLLVACAIVAIENPAAVCVISSRDTAQDPEEIEKEEQAAARGEWTAPAPELTAAQPRATDHSEGMQCPLCLPSSSLPKPGALSCH
ncbi:hypothetical protein QTO34_018501 [Cnephaeus nilssonii]|uniref:Uncharacterized protein n=1 Tax=Cnephaeus nilssonii TaxID=3371016 RepID=A0AA40HYX6_CNENI|nr:hypothetical protein QTO34_018501 [Eptesicus nilssonii]